MLKVIAPPRGRDRHGSGEFGAPRGGRTHEGVDYAVAPNSLVLPLRSGKVTKLGYPYGDDLSFRYVEVTDARGYRWRYYYVEPMVQAGLAVEPGDAIGLAQDLRPRYKGIKPHVHLEVHDPTGRALNPETLLKR